jgi:hypothetical protein
MTQPTQPAPGTYEGIVVLGSPRSGTTLLRRLINAHPRIACPPETNLLRACSRFLHEDHLAEGLNVGVRSGLAFSDIREDDVLDRLREFAFGFFRQILARSGKARWAEKTAFDIFHLENIERLLGSTCRYVCLFRHGLDVACSLKDLCDVQDRYLVELHEYVRRHSSPLEAFTHAWADVNTQLLEFIGNNRDLCFAMKYEDLLADPEPHLSQLFEFLDEPADAGEVVRAAFAGGAEAGFGDWKTYATRGLERGSVGRWKELSPDSIHRLGAIANPVMERLGYEPVPLPEVPSREQARRRYRASCLVRQMDATKR